VNGSKVDDVERIKRIGEIIKELTGMQGDLPKYKAHEKDPSDVNVMLQRFFKVAIENLGTAKADLNYFQGTKRGITDG